MKELFTDIYKKVVNFFQQEKEEAENSKEIAQNRLKLVLMHDRAKLDAPTIEKMRLELVKVISKYVEIDEDALDINLEGDGSEFALMLNIPVIRAKDPEEIAKNEEVSDEDTSEEDNKEVTEEVIEETENSEEEPEVADEKEETSEDEDNSDEVENNDEETENSEVVSEDEVSNSVEKTSSKSKNTKK